MEQKNLIEKINRLKKQKNAVILAHVYQRPEIYEVADFIGDSYGLSKQATKTDAEIIVFCGVDFMAESAYILNPTKIVLIPTKLANCPMAAMVDVDGLRELKAKHPDASVVSYVNTTAEVKAESDICCTSANAVNVVNSLAGKKVIFVPDSNLANYVMRNTDKQIIPWNGWCYVHNKFSPAGIFQAKVKHVDAKVLVHPECVPEVVNLADEVFSTTGMINYVKGSSDNVFIIATEIGVVERLRQMFPEKTFYQAPPGGTCLQMKKTTLELVLASLEKEQFKVVIPENIRVRAKKALDRMLNVA
ncbi:MAG: quinolinate synthase NadA [Candidatus Bathyarchaeota archaeon]|nr:MAG: quinolinate synthase NadA [Candidatus Bathyarchaeum tardum]WNZ30237.1 MAG: quinolinate synthase NadA [Candidatus Bathyarchaeota archaeon]